jgi:hypothetical protein
MKVNFLHPRSSELFSADVAGSCTGADAIKGLLDAGFLTPAPAGMPYGLVSQKTGKEMLPQTSLEEAGVGPDDTISVFQEGRGAAPGRFSSGG